MLCNFSIREIYFLFLTRIYFQPLHGARNVIVDVKCDFLLISDYVECIFISSEGEKC